MKVAVLGYGTVGFGVHEMLKGAKGLEAGPVLVRPGKENEDFKVSSIDEIVNDPSVGAVAEVLGGIEPAYTYACKAIKAKKHFVTSNKALVADKGIELASLAKENGVSFLFSAACGGGVPFLHNLSLAVESDNVKTIGGILNGTTNYMLDAMQRRSLSYEEALKDAQDLGYAEADPTADVTGLDALRKIMLGCAVAFNELPVDGLLNEGIDSFTSDDVRYLKDKGLTCRLVVSGGKGSNGNLYAYVEPVVFTSAAPECAVLNNYNLAKYDCENSGPIVFMGQGAGRWPTASAVLRDLSDILSGRGHMMLPTCQKVKADNSACCHKYLLRIDAEYEITDEMSVEAMHSKAKDLRKEGKKVFFAAIGE